MKKIFLVAATLLLIQTTTYAQPQGRGKQHDPKEMTAKAAKELNFSDDQMEKLETLNKEYKGDDYDRKKYRDAFREIMTDEQKQKAGEMRKQRGHRGGPRHKNIRE